MFQDANKYLDVIHDLLALTAPLHFGPRPGTEKLLSRDESLTRLAGEAKMLWQPVCLCVSFGDDRCESHPVRKEGPGTMLDRNTHKLAFSVSVALNKILISQTVRWNRKCISLKASLQKQLSVRTESLAG